MHLVAAVTAGLVLLVFVQNVYGSVFSSLGQSWKCSPVKASSHPSHLIELRGGAGKIFLCYVEVNT